MAEKSALTFDHLIGCKRLRDPQFSPSGEWISFAVQTMNETENSSQTVIWRVAPDGSNLEQLTNEDHSSWNARWSPDGKKIAFLSDRSGSTQIWLMNPDGSNARALTTHYGGASDFLWSPNGKMMAFVTRVYPDCPGFECLEKRDQAKENSAVQARVYEELLYRHWDTWWDHKRSHIFVLNLESGESTDVTPGAYDAPPVALSEGYTFSADSRYLYFSSNHDPVVATSTNNDIFKVSVDGGPVELVTTRCPDREFKANDSSPLISPDGKYLSFLSMRRPGFEADKFDLFLLNLESGEFRSPTLDWDRSIGDYQWMPDGQQIIARVDEGGHYKLFRIKVKTGQAKALVEDGSCRYPSVSPDGRTIAFLQQSYTRPYELVVLDTKRNRRQQITHFNDNLLADVEMNPAEDFYFESKDGTRIHGFIIKPPFFRKDQKYPMVYFIHGGPQGAWQDEWHYRWNPQMWAAQGYVMVMVNPRGSTGYGQDFTDQISKDWAGRVFEDLVAGQQYVVDSYQYIDADRLAAAGASYGGYMINWIEGHMDAFAYPFRTLVNHDGSFNLYAKMLTTEELWFPEWEFDGPYWENDSYYAKFSPHNFVKNFKTPMLVIHGERDYRLDFGEALMVFTALRRVDVPAKLVLFPDEGHWVQKPQNSRFWHDTIFEWLAEYLQ